ncbi:hypothetical protein [Oleidesulfovibrio sp.]|uniref:hypothetical protein n=1 Tax=Oleidesulfovibrio sp. TaxID=2909707 RepID=UPI003A88CA52
MTTDHDWVDGAQAAYQKAFSGRNLIADAATWLICKGRLAFPSKELFLFISDTALQPDNRITRYRMISRRPYFSKIIWNEGAVLCEGFEDVSGGLLFWAIVCIKECELPSVLDYLRSDRGSFLFFATEPAYGAPLSGIMRSRVESVRASIDNKSVIEGLSNHGLIPVRVWGPSGERELWVEIYSPSALGST